MRGWVGSIGSSSRMGRSYWVMNSNSSEDSRRGEISLGAVDPIKDGVPERSADRFRIELGKEPRRLRTNLDGNELLVVDVESQTSPPIWTCKEGC